MESNKIVIGVVGVVVAVLLICTLMIPIVNENAQGTETTTEVAGGYGTLMYQGTPESPTGMAIQYILLQPSDTDNTIINVYKGGNLNDPITTIDINTLDGKNLIVYSDINAVLSIQNGKYVFTGNTTLPSDSDITNTVSVSYNRQVGMVYDNRIESSVRISGQTTYYYAYSNSGDYANFEGDNPPAMDTPAVSVDGVYIGKKYITETITPPYAMILNVLPILMIITVMMFAVGFIVYRRF